MCGSVHANVRTLNFTAHIARNISAWLSAIHQLFGRAKTSAAAATYADLYSGYFGGWTHPTCSGRVGGHPRVSVAWHPVIRSKANQLEMTMSST
jgi:hypothetical protein